MIRIKAVLGLAAVGLFSCQLQARDFEDVEIEVFKIADTIYLLRGRGGNIGVSVGPDGVFLVDDQYAPLTEKIKAAVSGISDRPIRFVLNTHYHGDHTGGNENLGKAGVVVVSQDNVRKRLVHQLPELGFQALPIVTFSETVTFHINGDEVYAFHTPQAHTDGDTIVLFRNAKVVHMGDVFFNRMYPRIDLDAGGSVRGVLDAIDTVSSPQVAADILPSREVPAKVVDVFGSREIQGADFHNGGRRIEALSEDAHGCIDRPSAHWTCSPSWFLHP